MDNIGWLADLRLISIYILVYFDGHPELEMAKNLGRDTSWLDRLPSAAINFAEYSIGGKVFGEAYAGTTWKVVSRDSILAVSDNLQYGLVFILLRNPSEDQWLKIIDCHAFSITVAIFLQYMLTKSAIRSTK
ncbi:MAG: hypothetical protein R3F40_07725 [Candidatus Competibacteraceae bacterium]